MSFRRSPALSRGRCGSCSWRAGCSRWWASARRWASTWPSCATCPTCAASPTTTRALASRVVDRDGQTIGEFFSERRRLTPLESVPPHVVNAFVAGEDSSFFEHEGIDFSSILRAAWVNLRTGGEIKQGGSTITQQMVKGLLLTPERTYRRKIREMILARNIEQHFTKQEILYLYLNQIYFGHGAYGIGEAAQDLLRQGRVGAHAQRGRPARRSAEGAVALLALRQPGSAPSSDGATCSTACSRRS